MKACEARTFPRPLPVPASPDCWLYACDLAFDVGHPPLTLTSLRGASIGPTETVEIWSGNLSGPFFPIGGSGPVSTLLRQHGALSLLQRTSLFSKAQMCFRIFVAGICPSKLLSTSCEVSTFGTLIRHNIFGLQSAGPHKKGVTQKVSQGGCGNDGRITTPRSAG